MSTMTPSRWLALGLCGLLAVASGAASAADPGTPVPASTEASDQKAGDVLVYSLYTSDAVAPAAQDTRLSLTNGSAAPAFVHLFLVQDTGSVADTFVCLAANQTRSLQLSALDPGTTGYAIAIAVDGVLGCPVGGSVLSGQAHLKLASGFEGTLKAVGVSGLFTGTLPGCDGTSVTAALDFDGTRYNRLPRVVQLDNLPSRADGDRVLLVLNHLGGNLGIGLPALPNVLGLMHDDASNTLSFAVTGQAQLRSELSNTFPRLTPRFETYIPAGRTGWMILNVNTGADVAVLGAAMFQGRVGGALNLRALTLSATGSLTVPVFPPAC